MTEGRVTISELVATLEKLREEHGDLEVWLSVCYEIVIHGSSDRPDDYETDNAFASGPLMSGGLEGNIEAVCRDPRHREVLTVELSAIDS